MNKTKQIQEIYHIDFVKVTRGTDKNLKKCISMILDHFKYKLKEDYKVRFHSRFDWQQFPKRFSLYKPYKTFDCYFYKEKKGPQILKAEMEQCIDEEGHIPSAHI